MGKGEVIGIIGSNGAGKSTLLKILSRITEPTSGKAEIIGRVGSLLEVGTGFHEELTGRENIYFSGAILGMRSGKSSRLDEIVDFSGVEKFIDTPMKRYSSGMKVRLGFAVASHLEPEILLVDEVLAVGDYSFQKRSLNKMSDVARQGRTVLFVSHNMSAIANLTQKTLVLETGQVVFFDDSSEAIDLYLSKTRDSNANIFTPSTAIEKGGDKARIINCQLVNIPQTGKPVNFILTVERDANVSTLECDFSISFLKLDGTKILQLYSTHMGKTFSIGPGLTEIEAHIDSFPLVPGNYKVNLWLGTGSTPIHWLEDSMTLRVEYGTLDGERVIESRGYPVVAATSWSQSTTSAI